MTMKTRIGLVFISAAAIALGGCRSSRSGSSSIPKGGNTPREAMQNLSKGFKTENVEMIKAVIYVPDESREYADIALDLEDAMHKFQQDLEKTYGKEAVEDYTNLKYENVPSSEEIEKMTFKEEGDTAAAQYKEEAIKFIKKDGQWFVDLSDKMPRGDLGLTIKCKKQEIEIIEKYHRKIGEEGYTAKIIQAVMIQELNRCIEDMSAQEDAVAPGENPEAPDDENNTPKAALLKLSEAYKALDLNAIVANFHMDRKDEIYIEEMLMYDLTIERFERKLKAAYSSGDLQAAGFTFSDETDSLTPEDIDNMTFSVAGDTAIATGEDGTSIEFIKEDGRWLIVFHDELPPVEDREKIRSRAMVIDRIFNGLMPKIGAKGVTAQGLHEEYEAEMRKAIESFNE